MRDKYEDFLAQADAAANILANADEEMSDADVDRLADILDQVKDPVQDLPSNNGVEINEDNNTSEISSERVVGIVSGNGTQFTLPSNVINDLSEEGIDRLINLNEEDIGKLDINLEYLKDYASL